MPEHSQKEYGTMIPYKHVGFVSTRLAGLDGVSLEAKKWARFFEQEKKMQCFFMAGLLDTPPERSFLVKEAGFWQPRIQEIYEGCFGVKVRDPEMTDLIHEAKCCLKRKLQEFMERFSIDLLVVENALAIPMNLPLGMAIAEYIAENGTPTIAHHHDFFWERPRFLTNAVWEYLNMAFPPHIPFIQHVVINSAADNQLSLRTGISAAIIPNVMDYEHPPAPPDSYADDLRRALGVQPDDYLILQPTRVVKRKGIEHAVELVYRLNQRLQRTSVLVISHASGDEGDDYARRIRSYSDMLGVRTLFVSDRVQEHRRVGREGEKIYSLEDLYTCADLITYPSTYEGFGNAFLEAVYYRKPIVVNSYAIYESDIKGKGFHTIEIDGYVTEASVAQAAEVLEHTHKREQVVERNYQRALRFFSYNNLKIKLNEVLLQFS